MKTDLFGRSFGTFAKRTILFILTNVLVMITISVILSLLGVDRYASRYGLDLRSLAIFSLVWGMAGSLISLAISRFMAKMSMGVQLVTAETRSEEAQFLYQTVKELALQARLPEMPEVGIYESSDLNAFATGPSKSRSLVAVSSGLLRNMTRKEIEGVLAHEVAHIANGDMVTMTLLQGIVNAFALFMSRLLGWMISQAFRGDRDERSSGLGFFGTYMIQMALEMVFMLLGSLVVAAFSRYREFRADAGGARLAGREPMVAALKKLKMAFEHPQEEEPEMNSPVAALKISGGNRFLKLFSTHPPLDERIERLENTPHF